jgi:hypothetical protein
MADFYWRENSTPTIYIQNNYSGSSTVVFILTRNQIENGIEIPATAEYPDKSSETKYN